MRKNILNAFSHIVLLCILMHNSVWKSYAIETQHFIMYGQSLSTGHQSWPSLSVDNISGNYMLGSQVWTNFGNTTVNQLSPLVANVAHAVATLPKTRSSSIYAECPLIAAVNHIRLKTNNTGFNILASSCGTGGKSIEELSKEYYNSSAYYGWYTKTLDYAVNAIDDIKCPAIFWMQGEFNYAPGASTTGLTVGSKPTANKQVYKTLLYRLKEQMQTDVKNKYNQATSPLFITYQAGAQYTRGKTLEIGMAQLEAANEKEDIICAGPVYPMTDRGGHLDPNGYRWYGEMLGKAYYRTKVLGQKFIPLQPSEVFRTNNTRELAIRFKAVKFPLVLDELLVKKVADYGFELYDNSIKKTIQSIRIQNDCVVITSTTDLTGTLEIVYAGQNTAGHGNLRDSDDEVAFFNYIDLDKKKLDGSFFYERDAVETTLRPNYEPRDDTGIIYDKPYPLYNFSVAFYYKLEQNEQTFRVQNVYETNTHNAQVNATTQLTYLGDKTIVVNNEGNPYKLYIIDMNGAVIKKSVSNKTSHTHSYSLSMLPKGIYVAMLYMNNQRYSLKITL